MAWVIDLDGVMWLAHDPIPGSADAVGTLVGAGEDVLFVTNNSAVPVADVEQRLVAMGVEGEGRVVSSAEAAASRVQPGERAFVCGGEGVRRALQGRGATLVDGDGHVDVVVVGLTRSFDYDLLSRASSAVRGGARLLATNDDATYPTPAGLLPGGGALLAAVVTASGVAPEIAGKPHAAMVDLVTERLGTDGLVVGDRPDTDGAFARALGYRFGLVLSGVTRREEMSGELEPRPDAVADDLAALVAQGPVAAIADPGR